MGNRVYRVSTNRWKRDSHRLFGQLLQSSVRACGTGAVLDHNVRTEAE